MFRKTIQEEKSLITNIKAGGKNLRLAMHFLYNQSGVKEMVFKYILDHNGSREDAEDIFQEGICAFILNVQRNKFDGRSNWKTYFVGICKNLWRSKFERIKKQEIIKIKNKTPQTSDDTPETLFLEKEQNHSLQQLLGILGSNCKKILMLWLKSFSIKEMVDRTEYKNENVVSKKKHQCLRKLYKIMEAHPQLRKRLIT